MELLNGLCGHSSLTYNYIYFHIAISNGLHVGPFPYLFSFRFVKCKLRAKNETKSIFVLCVYKLAKELRIGIYMEKELDVEKLSVIKNIYMCISKSFGTNICFKNSHLSSRSFIFFVSIHLLSATFFTSFFCSINATKFISNRQMVGHFV